MVSGIFTSRSWGSAVVGESNKALHLIAIMLRFIAPGELGR